MTTFDYLHDARPAWMLHLLGLRLPQTFAAPLCALLCGLTLLCVAAGMERGRLSAAQHAERAFRVRCERSEQAVKSARLYYDRVAALVAIDKRLRAAELSGEQRARAFARIANALPAHAWLTSISRDGAAIELEGGARNVRTVSETIASLGRLASLRGTALQSIAALSTRTGDSRVSFAIVAQEAP